MKQLSHRLLPILALAVAALAGCSSSDDDGDDAGDGATACDALLAGDLVVSEVLANPTGDDQGNEYFEIFNASSREADLGGLELVASGEEGAEERTHAVTSLTIEPGGYAVVGGVLPELAPEHVNYGYASDLGSLRNSGGHLALRCGGVEIDGAAYPSAEGRDGIAFGVDGASAPDPIANDAAESFCAATREFAPGLFGSPGEANEACGVIATGKCTDEDGERDTIAPAAGDLVITEVMADPNDQITDAVGEWFEVRATRAVDLNGLVAGTDVAAPKPIMTGTECVTVPEGGYAVLARTDDAEVNGGLDEVAGTFGFGLTNTDGSLFVGVGETVLDAVTWAGSTAGSSRAVAADVVDPGDNDDQAAWFTCAVPYGDFGLKGTPAAANDTCEASGETCLDGGDPRPMVAPGRGDLLITEVMANPAAVGDTAGEWFEVEVLADVDLNGLEIGETAGEVDQTLTDATCLHFEAGSFVLFARNTSSDANGGLPAVDFQTSQSLGQTSADSLFVGYAGTVIDQLGWEPADVAAGAARSREGGSDTFCDAVDAYGAGNLGTPGAANPACP